MRGSLLLLSALLLLESTDGNGYDQLSQHDKKIIDRAIEAANERHGKAKHLDFASIITVDSAKRILNVLLKPTTCDKTKLFVHRKDCEIQNKATPQVSCIDCHGAMSCLLLREKEKIKQTVKRCSESGSIYHSGGSHVLFQKGENEQQTGCLGCI